MLGFLLPADKASLMDTYGIHYGTAVTLYQRQKQTDPNDLRIGAGQ